MLLFNYLGNKDGFVHISEICEERIETVSSVLKQGDIVKVKLIGFDNKGKAKLTIKNADKDKSSNNTKPKLMLIMLRTIQNLSSDVILVKNELE